MGMLNVKSALNGEQVNSPLLQASHLGPYKGKKGHKEFPVLSLTSLIDAFSIIVIYLLISTTANQFEVPISPTIVLPQADKGDMIAEESPIVRIEQGKFYIENTWIAESQLGKRLFELKQKLSRPDMPIIVQADQQTEFKNINPLIIASSQAGIQKIKFAVVPPQ